MHFKRWKDKAVHKLSELNRKQTMGLLIAILGFFLMCYGVYLNRHVFGAKGEIEKMNSSRNSIVRSMGKDMETKVGHYSIRTTICLLGGGIILLGGCGMMYYYRKRTRN